MTLLYVVRLVPMRTQVHTWDEHWLAMIMRSQPKLPRGLVPTKQEVTGFPITYHQFLCFQSHTDWSAAGEVLSMSFGAPQVG